MPPLTIAFNSPLSPMEILPLCLSYTGKFKGITSHVFETFTINEPIIRMLLLNLYLIKCERQDVSYPNVGSCCVMHKCMKTQAFSNLWLEKDLAVNLEFIGLSLLMIKAYAISFGL